mmetsp:Transcript_20606/g.53263  ORF Transcript_20606/g.53263 Transcript_20606/m.53263 type:complete len:85 (+) Transcript_20606:363-617(+)
MFARCDCVGSHHTREPMPLAQNHLLDEIEGGVDRTSTGMRSAQARMVKLLKRTKDCKWICAIIALAAIAVLLLVWIFRFGGKTR